MLRTALFLLIITLIVWFLLWTWEMGDPGKALRAMVDTIVRAIQKVGNAIRRPMYRILRRLPGMALWMPVGQ